MTADTIFPNLLDGMKIPPGLHLRMMVLVPASMAITPARGPVPSGGRLVTRPYSEHSDFIGPLPFRDKLPHGTQPILLTAACRQNHFFPTRTSGIAPMRLLHLGRRSTFRLRCLPGLPTWPSPATRHGSLPHLQVDRIHGLSCQPWDQLHGISSSPAQ